MCTNKTISEIYDINETMAQLKRNLRLTEKKVLKSLKEYQKEQGLTGRALARKLGITAAYMCDIQLGRRNISESVLAKLADLL